MYLLTNVSLFYIFVGENIVLVEPGVARPSPQQHTPSASTTPLHPTNKKKKSKKNKNKNEGDPDEQSVAHIEYIRNEFHPKMPCVPASASRLWIVSSSS